LSSYWAVALSLAEQQFARTALLLAGSFTMTQRHGREKRFQQQGIYRLLPKVPNIATPPQQLL